MPVSELCQYLFTTPKVKFFGLLVGIPVPRYYPLDILTAPNIKKVYGAEVYVYPHPINKLPTTLITAGGSHGTS
jgi:hypothetical protein